MFGMTISWSLCFLVVSVTSRSESGLKCCYERRRIPGKSHRETKHLAQTPMGYSNLSVLGKYIIIS